MWKDNIGSIVVTHAAFACGKDDIFKDDTDLSKDFKDVHNF